MTRSSNKAKLENRLDNLMKRAKPTPAPKQTADPEMAPIRSRSLPLTLAFLTILLLFSVVQVQPKPPTITGPIAAITVNQAPAIQNADLIDTNAPLTVIQNQPGFHCYAGCSFLRPSLPVEPVTMEKNQSI